MGGGGGWSEGPPRPGQDSRVANSVGLVRFLYVRLLPGECPHRAHPIDHVLGHNRHNRPCPKPKYSQQWEQTCHSHVLKWPLRPRAPAVRFQSHSPLGTKKASNQCYLTATHPTSSSACSGICKRNPPYFVCTVDPPLPRATVPASTACHLPGCSWASCRTRRCRAGQEGTKDATQHLGSHDGNRHSRKREPPQHQQACLQSQFKRSRDSNGVRCIVQVYYPTCSSSVSARLLRSVMAPVRQ